MILILISFPSLKKKKKRNYKEKIFVPWASRRKSSSAGRRPVADRPGKHCGAPWTPLEHGSISRELERPPIPIHGTWDPLSAATSRSTTRRSERKIFLPLGIFGRPPLFVPSKSREKERIEYFSFHYRPRKHPEIKCWNARSPFFLLCPLHRFEWNSKRLMHAFFLPFDDTHSRTKNRRTETEYYLLLQLLVSIVLRAKMRSEGSRLHLTKFFERKEGSLLTFLSFILQTFLSPSFILSIFVRFIDQLLLQRR